MSKLFCARCGRALHKDSLLPGFLCPTCYAELKLPSPSLPRLEVTLCPKCLSYLHGKHWVKSGCEDPVEAASKAILQAAQRSAKPLLKGVIAEFKVDEEGLQDLYTSNRTQTNVIIIIRPPEANVSKTLEQQVVVRFQLCPQCSRARAGGFEAVVQVRADGRSLKDADLWLINRALSKLAAKYQVSERGTYLVEVKEVHGGVDVKFSSPKIARRFAEELRSLGGAVVKYSYKMKGIDSRGKTTYTTAISVRLPKFSIGDIVRFKGEFAIVESFDRDRFIATLLRSRKKISIPHSSVWKGNEVMVGFSPRTMSVASIHGNSATLVDLASGESYEVPAHILPPWVKAGDKIRVLESDGRFLVVG